MPKEEWGVKRECPNCKTRFYDLQRDPMTCPSCGHSFTLETLSGGRGEVLVRDTSVKPEVEEEDELLDVLDTDDVLDDDVEDDVLEEDDDDTVSLEEIADVSPDDDEV
ncbi:MAG: TIGR02300 family protein [Alphaproteobacteria bacterium]|nr:MAG: TIGR02300 family protein [Alphaproteobacteria bacterium]